MTQQRAVVYDHVGSPDVLHLAEVPVPTPSDGRVLLAVRAVGINPYDAKVRAGLAPKSGPFPRGIGSDVAGEVVDIGPDAAYADGSPVQVGDLVYGWGLNTLRERLIVRAASIARVPTGLPLDVAGSLATVGLTAQGAIEAVPVHAGDTVLVSSGSGSVGFLIAQLARRAGARVIGTTGASNDRRLAEAGITPVRYGDGLVDNVRALTDRVDVVFDTAGAATLTAAATLGASPARTYTIAGDDVAARFGARGPNDSPRSIAALDALGALVAAGEVSLPIAEAFALDDVAAAFSRLETGHPGGKIVIRSAA